MITLVMPSAQGGGGESLTLQASPTVPAGDVTLRASAVLLRPPGQEVAVWTVDGVRAGVSTWTLVRRRADGLSVWQTGITVAFAEGAHVVTIALRSMVDGASVTAVPAGGGTLTRLLYWVRGADPGPLGAAGNPIDADDWPSGNGWGSTPDDPLLELIEAPASAVGWVMAQALTLFGPADSAQFALWDVSVPPGYVNGSLLVQAVGSSLLLQRVGTSVATGDYTVSCTVDGESLGPIVLRIA